MFNTAIKYYLNSACAGAAIFCFSSIAIAAEKVPTGAEMWKLVQVQQAQIDKLKTMLKKNQQQAQSAASTAREAKRAAVQPRFLGTLQIGGTIEVEATQSETFAGVDASDVTLAKVEVFLDAKPAEYLSTHVQLIYEDDGTETISLDEAFAVIGNTEQFPAYLQAGKWVMPFGNFDTSMSTDPLTKTLGETKEAAILAGITGSGATLEAFFFNGDTQKNGDDDKIDQFGLNAAYSAEFDDGAFTVGASYINNLADSDEITGLPIGNQAALADYVGGASVNGSVTYSGVTFVGGYMQALESFQSAELAFNGSGARPKAWNTEISYTMQIAGRDTTFAAILQGSDEALALSLPEQRIGGAVTVGVLDKAAVTLEYLLDEDYGTAEGGTGNDAHIATAKITAEF